MRELSCPSCAFPHIHTHTYIHTYIVNSDESDVNMAHTYTHTRTYIHTYAHAPSPFPIIVACPFRTLQNISSKLLNKGAVRIMVQF